MLKPYLFDYHIQTLEHGANKPFCIEETIETAIERGLSAICLTDHCPLPAGFVDPTPEKDCAMPLSKYKRYRIDLEEVRKKYGDHLDISIGAEFDWLPEYQEWIKSQLKKWPFDYTIGSIHFLGKISDAKKGERNFLIDYTEEEFRRGIAYYGGIIKLIKSYYYQVKLMILSGLFNSVGHFDLIKKFNSGSMFDESENWYQTIVRKTLDVLVNSKMALEINTAGLKQTCQAPYPSFWILKEASKRKIPVTIGSDAHKPEDVGKNLELAIKLAKKAGYESINKFINRQRIKVTI